MAVQGSRAEGWVTFHLAVKRCLEDGSEYFKWERITVEFVEDLVDRKALPKSVLTEDRYLGGSFHRDRIEWLDEGCPIQVKREVRKVPGYEEVLIIKSVIVTGEKPNSSKVRKEIIEF